MSAPKTTETNIGVMPFIVFAMLLFVPFLNFELTYYHMSLKLFGFAMAVAVLACYLLWEWAAGRLKGSGLPAYWLFAPAVAWVVWGLLTALWSRDGWLAAGWVAQGAWGLAGAWCLAVLLRERGPRQVFVAAASVVALALALFMAALYGDPHQTFFGDTDLVGRSVAAAFLLVPTLVAAAMLYGLGAEEDESAYKRVIWLTALLLVLLVAGLRTVSWASWPPAAWVLGLSAGLAVVVWLMLPRWRLGAVALVVFTVVTALRAEVRVAQAAEDFLTARPLAHYGLFDAADRQIIRSASLTQLLFGRGVGSFVLVFDRYRTPVTYATPRGNIVETHARRTITEVAAERGLVGLALGGAMGVACLAAGAMALRRAQSRFDAALGVGLAAGVVAMGVFGCFSNGTAGFGASMAFWVALGLLGALSVGTARKAALGYSAEEEAAAREHRREAPAWRGLLAVGGGLAVVVVWFALALRPFLADWCLKEGVGEYQGSMSPGADAEFLRRAERYLGAACSLSLGDRVWLHSQITQAQCDLGQRKYADSADRLESLEDKCGRIFDLDFFLGRCYAGLGQPDTASRFFRRYLRRDPFAVSSALYPTRRNCYGFWFNLIYEEREKQHPKWQEWAKGLIKVATAGLSIDPDRYILLIYRGKMAEFLGNPGEMRRDMALAAQIAQTELDKPERYPPLIRGKLILELAQALMHVDKVKALGAIKGITSLPLSRENPAERGVLIDATRIGLALEGLLKGGSIQKESTPLFRPEAPAPPH